MPDFPKPGFAQLIGTFAAYYIGKEIDLVLGIEARVSSSAPPSLTGSTPASSRSQA